jgi:hypothetical protein
LHLNQSNGGFKKGNGMYFIGHGNARFEWDTWHNCLELAKTFGWLPGGAFPPFDHGRDLDTFFSEDFREVSDADARALGAALYRAVAAAECRQELSEQQQLMLQACMNVSLIRALADYAIMGSFAIA